MAFALWKRCVFAVLMMAGVVTAQQPASPKFDVVSIRAVPPNTKPVLRDIDFMPVKPGGQYIDSRTGLLSMISLAHNVKDPSIRLVGLPDWAKKQAYSVAAKPVEGFPNLPPAENIEQVRLMLRAMLADRFHLQLHTETRQEQVFNLEVANGFIKLKNLLMKQV